MSEIRKRYYNHARSNKSAEEVLGKRLPASIEAERSVLAAILLNSDNLTLISDSLKPTDFYKLAHQDIYKSILELAQSNKKIDLVLMQNNLETQKKLESCGGIE